MAQTISLLAPISGLSRNIEQVPDEVFAQKMVGDGLAIDPLGNVLLAPCDGEIVVVHSAHHALTIRTKEGIEVLMHVGLETVELKGQGFTLKVKQGDKVKQGQELLEFDADYIATHAKSLLTEIVVTNMDMLSDYSFVYDRTVKAGSDVIMKLTVGGAGGKEIKGPAPCLTSAEETAESWDIEIINKVGMHARPAAALANAAKKYSSDIKIIKGGKEANAKSIVSIMGLDIKKADKVVFSALGSDAVDALTEIIPLAADGFGEGGAVPAAAVKKAAAKKAARSDDPNVITGIYASPGLGIGSVFVVAEEKFDLKEKGGDATAETKKFDHAVSKAKYAIEQLYNEFLSVTKDQEKAQIFKAHLEILEDPELIKMTKDMVKDGYTAEFAWDKAFHIQMETLRGLQDELLSARANDVRDVGLRVLRILTGKPADKLDIPKGSIIIAEELSPSDLTTIKHENLAGVATTHGSATSHFTIIARTLGIPSVVGIEDRALELAKGTLAVLDGNEGTLRINLKENEISDFKNRQKSDAEKRKKDLAESSKPAITTDGVKIEVVGNAGNVKDAEAIVKNGGEGVGLLRSEFLFIERKQEPSEEEQADVYTAIAHTLGKDRSLIVRTLDVGGDKPLSYIDMHHEDNPFLGVRGIRFTLRHEEFFRTQIRAILKAAGETKLRIMFPMISELDELVTARRMVEEEMGKSNVTNVEIGIMVEVPSAAVMAYRLAEHADFFSIGTNDLTQYTLAMDRSNSDLAQQADGLHPAVLNMIDITVKGANAHGKWVGVCGGLAGEEIAVPVLIGLGIKELSAPAPSIPGIKARIRSLGMTDCEGIAADTLKMASAKEVRDYLKNKV